jgi:hypothetical protein
VECGTTSKISHSDIFYICYVTFSFYHCFHTAASVRRTKLPCLLMAHLNLFFVSEIFHGDKSEGEEETEAKCVSYDMV